MQKITKTLGTALFVALAAASTFSCGNRAGWTIEGNIAGASDSTLYIEEPSGATWIIVDSVKAGGNGDFAFTAVYPPARPQAIYRIRLNDKVAYFPVDSTETLRLTAAHADMDRVHTLTGSPAALGFNAADSLINAAVERVGAREALNDDTLLRQLGELILADTTGVVSYYIVNRPIEDRHIFTPDNRRKVGLIGAAATRYKTFRPGDPRGAELEAMFAEARRAIGRAPKGSGQSIVAVELGRPDVEFEAKDYNGNVHNLNEVLDRGGVTVVNLVRYDDPKSAANTAALGEVYEAYGNRGLEIFQIGFDPNVAHWRQNAVNMPWITVYGTPEEAADFLVTYNVNPIDGGPITLLFDRNGELVKRITNPAELKEAVSKLL